MFNKKLLTIILALGIASFSITSVSAEAQTKRLWGSDRYGTCADIVKDGWQTTSYYAVIVNGENFPDALSAAPLAQKYKAPILLTENDTLNSNTADQLKRLNVKKVFIVGGQGVVSAGVEKAINNLGIETVRYKGEDRGETSIKVASQVGTKNGVIVAIDDDYTDALSAAPIAANLQMPIILVSKDTFSSSLSNFILMNNIPKTYVLGDSNIISDRVANMFPNVKRITGSNKYERNINIIKEFESNVNFGNVCIAYSEQFADALSGAAFAANNSNPIILVGNNVENCTNSLIKDKLSSIKNVTVLGGSAGVKDSLVTNLLSGGSDSSDDNGVVLTDSEGNTSGNLRNGGFVVEKNGWIYYIKDGNKICRAKTDGTQEMKLMDVKNARSLNVVDGYLYYVARTGDFKSTDPQSDQVTVYRESISGGRPDSITGQHEKSFGKGFPYMLMDGHWLLYSPEYTFISKENANYYNNFYKMDTETLENKKSYGGYLGSLAVENGYVYFTTLDDNRIRRMPTSGNKDDDGELNNKEIDLGLRGTVLDVVDNYIYYKDEDGNTYRIKEDKTERTKIVDLPEKFIINGDYLYYVASGKDKLGQLHKMNLDGTQDVGLNAYTVNNFAINGDWIYYRSNGNGNIYRIRLDGSSREEFPDKIAIKNIKDINVQVKQGDSYELPTAVWTAMEDGSYEYYSVTWDKNSIDTNTVGTYKALGTVEGYSSKVNLTVEVK
ncbi:hypothetical protein Ccar_22660 [Clostridium carboxidivorans P7]|uniref:Ig domain protein n=1 Tax=Clostridium carboxidivorans P7 TaxID=536227 RepID=C6PWJ0_9CLOT|nr:cell wall-binding repeat-containing protein [Clostridium carboxidivorans]AKN33475.1 hypothetical protein Ccar_22660 [Clostridium carboxidivorans P7]EET86401.1 Ig domain protein [Clostridium carboxidivorans P7]EFG89142.1 bacterial Ig-like domain (group 4) [Clostridium carboxidivorans P7]